MINKVSKSDLIKARLKLQEKLVECMQRKDIEGLEEMNAEMERIRQEYIQKNAETLKSASEVVLGPDSSTAKDIE